jgi:hypothetical protein
LASSNGPTKDQVAAQLGTILGKNYRDYDDFFRGELKPGRFLGQIISSIHPDLQDKLTAAESALNSQGYVSQPGSIYSIGGGDPKSGGHRWGLAIDINYLSNPYVMHDQGEADLDAVLYDLYERINLLMWKREHSVITNNITKGVPGGFATISDAYDQLKEESDGMVNYFSLMDDDARFNQFVHDWNTAKPGRIPYLNSDNWKARIPQDYLLLGGTRNGQQAPALPAGEDRPFALKSPGDALKRDPKKGFLDIPKPVVMALTGQGLIWGAIGFGPESGDIMHFDLRSGTFYSQVRQAYANAKAAL